LFSLDADVNWALLNDDKRLLAISMTIVLVLSLALFFLCRFRRWTAIIAVVFTVIWAVVLLPDTQYYLDTRDAGQLFGGKIGNYEIEHLIEPFDRRDFILGYLLVLLPIPFVLFGLYLRRRRSI
jgi:hypothetical protein